MIWLDRVSLLQASSTIVKQSLKSWDFPSSWYSLPNVLYSGLLLELDGRIKIVTGDAVGTIYILDALTGGHVRDCEKWRCSRK